jgi:hypothetical protein
MPADRGGGGNKRGGLRTDPQHEAEAFLTLLWMHIRNNPLWPMAHARSHERDGNDEIEIKIGSLKDVFVKGVDNGDTLIYDEVNERWIPGAGGGAGQAFFEMYGLFVGTIPGPTNLTGGPLTITRVLVKSDGAVAGSVTAGGAFSFIAGGGATNTSGLSYSWADGSSLSITVSSVGTDGTYLTCDVYFTG